MTVIYYNCELVTWRVEQQWVMNALSNKACLTGPSSSTALDFRIGIDYSFLDTSVIFSIIGAGFGCSFATTTIENILWSETVVWKRFARAFIGVGIMIGTFSLFSLVPQQEHTTDYVFANALPHLISSFLVFGIVPVLSKYFL